jgi:N-acetyl sugar amidotransferase
MKYCIKCVLPDSRPNLFILGNGICSACVAHANRKKEDWARKKINFLKILGQIKKKKNLYDCLIPVSGGKDSTWQVICALKHKLNPLAFTYKPVFRTKIGQKNLDNLKKIGVHHIDFSVNEKAEKKFLKKAFIRFGAVAIPMHMAMWNISFNLAKKFNIPYIFWGENSANEYGGSKKDLKIKNLNDEWIKKYGINFDTKPLNWIGKDLTEKDLAPFIRDKINKDSKYPKSIFLGDYYFWDPKKTYHIAKKYGFKNHKNKAKTGIYDYADIDDDLISIHHFLKIYKFGFSRVHDNLSLEIRNGRINRNKAIKIIKKRAFKIPHKDINKFCNFIGIKKNEFFKTCEKFRNKSIWKKKYEKWELIRDIE